MSLDNEFLEHYQCSNLLFRTTISGQQKYRWYIENIPWFIRTKDIEIQFGKKSMRSMLVENLHFIIG